MQALPTIQAVVARMACLRASAHKVATLPPCTGFGRGRILHARQTPAPNDASIAAVRRFSTRTPQSSGDTKGAESNPPVEESHGKLDVFAALRSRAPPRPPVSQIAASGVTAAICIAALAVPHHFDLLSNADVVMLIGSFGASACIIGGAHGLPVAQPRNVIGGHVISAAVGMAVFEAEMAGGDMLGMWCSAPLAAGLATAAMLATRTFHPPAAGTALIALIGSPKIHALGWWFVVTPSLSGPVILCGVGALVNRFILGRDYPTYWW